MYARRPLKVSELAEVLSVRKGDRGLKTEVMREMDILELCRGFIIVEPETTILQLTHQTGQIFLRNHHSHNIKPKRLDIATTCLSYLQFDPFEKWEEREIRYWRAKYKALPYIASHWGDHIEDVGKFDYVLPAVVTFLASERKRNLMLTLRGMYEHSTGGWTMLHVIAEIGLGTICKLVLEAQQAGSANRYSLFLFEFY